MPLRHADYAMLAMLPLMPPRCRVDAIFLYMRRHY